MASLDLDYVKGRLTLVLRDVDLGGFGEGTVPCVFGLALDGARSAVQVSADHRRRLLYR